MTKSEIGTDVARAVDILRRGGVVGLPTETVYGLGADASNPEAVARIFRIKGRPSDHPLIVHVSDTSTARHWTCNWTPQAQALADAFWPGPLTIVVERAAHVISEVTGELSTVALRCPSHPLMREVLESFGGGIAAPSANRFGKVSPTTALHVLRDLGDEVDYILDGGPCSVGLESTIVDCSTAPVQILRPGDVTLEQVIAVVDLVAPITGNRRAPGMLPSHYAPDCQVHPVESLGEAQREIEEMRAEFGSSGDTGIARIVVLDATVDPEKFATTMYAELRECDIQGVQDVFVVLPPDAGIGTAIRDRILKASSSR